MRHLHGLLIRAYTRVKEQMSCILDGKSEIR